MAHNAAVDFVWKFLEYMCRQLSSSVVSRPLRVTLIAIGLPRCSCQGRSLIERVVSRLSMSRTFGPCFALGQWYLCYIDSLLPSRSSITVLSYDLSEDVRLFDSPDENQQLQPIQFGQWHGILSGQCTLEQLSSLTCTEVPHHRQPSLEVFVHVSERCSTTDAQAPYQKKPSRSVKVTAHRYLTRRVRA
jgi:hypothetical protein